MKKLVVLFVFGLMIIPQARSQFFKKLKQKAANAVERTVLNKSEREVEKSTERAFDSVIEAPKSNKKKRRKQNSEDDEGLLNTMNILGGPVAYDDIYQFPITITMVIEDFQGKQEKSTIIQSFSKNAILVKDSKNEALTVMDFENKAALMLDIEKKEGNAVSLSFLDKMMGDVSSTPTNNETLVKTGRLKQILGYTAHEYEILSEKEKILVWFSSEVPFNVSDYMNGFQKLFSSKMNANWGEDFWKKYGYTLEMESYNKRGKLKSKMTTTAISEVEKIIQIKEFTIQKL